jgi:hypothetical protein
MSPTCENFIRAVLSQAWRDAFLQLNGLDMWEMLRALAALERQDLIDLWANQTAFLGAIQWGRDAMPRMEYARSVVVDRRLPSSAPGDLQATGQVGDAVEFLAHPDMRRCDIDRLLFENDLSANNSLPDANPAAGRLTDTDFEVAARELSIEVSAIQAVATVEAGGRVGFEAGRPIIRYELHKFRGETGRQYDVTHPHLSRPWHGKTDSNLYHDGTQRNEWSLLLGAMILRNAVEPAWRSASWGMFQVMGSNARSVGWPNVSSFVRDMFVSEAKHLRAFAGFCRMSGLVPALQSHDWTGFARGYNGPDFGSYDVQMANAYTRIRADRVRRRLTP